MNTQRHGTTIGKSEWGSMSLCVHIVLQCIAFLRYAAQTLLYIPKCAFYFVILSFSIKIILNFSQFKCQNLNAHQIVFQHTHFAHGRVSPPDRLRNSPTILLKLYCYPNLFPGYNSGRTLIDHSQHVPTLRIRETAPSLLPTAS